MNTRLSEIVTRIKCKEMYLFITLLWTHLSLQMGGTRVAFEPNSMASLKTSPP